MFLDLSLTNIIYLCVVYTYIFIVSIYFINNSELPQKDVWNPGGKLNPGFPEQQGHGQHKDNVDTPFCTVCSKTAMGKIK